METNIAEIVKQFADINVSIVNASGVEQKIPSSLNLHKILEELPPGVYCIQDEAKTQQIPFFVEDEIEDDPFADAEGAGVTDQVLERKYLDAIEKAQKSEIASKEKFYESMMQLHQAHHEQTVQMLIDNEERIDRRLGVILERIGVGPGGDDGEDEENESKETSNTVDKIVNVVREVLNGSEEDLSGLKP